MVTPVQPEELLADLDPEQRAAVLAVSGPVAILAGAGSGKTRVISRRTAYAIATGVVPADQVLVVTFTDKAAAEMVGRLRSLGLPGVTARTFHAHALSQLRFFWPLRYDGDPLPGLLESKGLIVSRLARQLPGHYRFTPAKDLADEIEWAKARRVPPDAYEARAAAGGRQPPIPVDLFVRIYRNYEREKTRLGRLDFDDLLAWTADLLEADVDAAATVRARKSWFSVDEYQDTNPLQQRLLELWLGPERQDLCVVGDEDQTIYSFTGATSTFLTTFEERWPGAQVLPLTRNYRSTPQVLELANRLVAAEGRTKRLVPTRSPGPPPTISKHRDAFQEMAALVAGIRARLADDVVASEIAVLVRMNAQLAPLEEALTRAGIAYQVRGLRFYDRPEIRSALHSLRRSSIDAEGPRLPGAIRERLAEALGWEEDGSGEGDEARERQAALDTLLAIVDEHVVAHPFADMASVLADLDARAAHERSGAVEGVNLLTYHRAKGLEWDAVFLPGLEEGVLPIRQAKDDEGALAEERRLLYVGITRARVHLALSWAERREQRGRPVRREVSRFVMDLRPRPGTSFRDLPPTGLIAAREARERAIRGKEGDPVVAALRAWRTARARSEAVPPYVIAHDATLAAIAAAHPRSLAALRRVKGMGPAKLDAYGDELLQIMAAVDSDESDRSNEAGPAAG